MSMTSDWLVARISIEERSAVPSVRVTPSRLGPGWAGVAQSGAKRDPGLLAVVTSATSPTSSRTFDHRCGGLRHHSPGRSLSAGAGRRVRLCRR